MKLFHKIIFVHSIFNLYVFYRGWKILPRKKIYRISLASLFALELFIYLIGYMCGEHLPSDMLRIIMLISTSWAVFILCMTVLLLFFDLARFLYLLIYKLTRKNKIKIKTLLVRRLYYCISVCLVIIVMSFGYYHFSHPIVSEKNVLIDKDGNNIQQLKIVMASDLHIGYLNNKQILHKYIDMIMQQKPDLILFAGDIIDYNLKPLLEQQADLEFKRLNAPYGVYACLGNHEHYADEKDKIKWLKEKSGITILQDSVVLIDNSLYIVGREDLKSPRQPLKSLIKTLDKNKPIIVLNHQPNDLNEEADNGIDIAFYGHTHNGQITPIDKFSKLLYELVAGYMQKKDTHIFVSSGLGIGGPQYRIGTDSEIIVVNLKLTNTQK